MAEAQPLIDYYSLKKIPSKSFLYFANENLLLLCCGVGKKKSYNIINSFLLKINVKISHVINIGISGGKKDSCNIGDCFLINEVIDDKLEEIYNIYYNIDTEIPFEQITTVCKPIFDGGLDFIGLVDMESYAICRCFRDYIKDNKLFIIKIVSDFMDVNRDYFSFNRVYDLINLNILKIDYLLINMHSKPNPS